MTEVPPRVNELRARPEIQQSCTPGSSAKELDRGAERGFGRLDDDLLRGGLSSVAGIRTRRDGANAGAVLAALAAATLTVGDALG